MQKVQLFNLIIKDRKTQTHTIKNDNINIYHGKGECRREPIYDMTYVYVLCVCSCVLYLTKLLRRFSILIYNNLPSLWFPP